jgi:GH24 family phage-related lysozyme (muramidase)
MQKLRKGNVGDEVVELQRALGRAGFAVPVVDGKFGDRTERAVRDLQIASGLLPDGVVGPKTDAVLKRRAAPQIHTAAPRGLASKASLGLGANAAEQRGRIAGIFGMHQRFGFVAGLGALRAMQAPRPANEISKNPQLLTLSTKGRDFIYAIETGARPSDNDGTGSMLTKHLHWPKGASGVTLGPGYDMRDRTAASIQENMEAIGMEKGSAKTLSGGAGLTGPKAQKFTEDTRSKVEDLTLAQELELLKIIAPKYEGIVKKWVKILLQHEYDALVCFTYNPRSSIVPVTSEINAGEVAKAMAIIKSRVPPPGDATYAGLVKRREREIALYTTGSYDAL